MTQDNKSNTELQIKWCESRFAAIEKKLDDVLKLLSGTAGIITRLRVLEVIVFLLLPILLTLKVGGFI